MKKCFCILSAILIVSLTNAQTNTFPSSGNVGVGNTTPPNKLTIGSSVSTNPSLNGITLGADHNTLEFTHSVYSVGYASKFYGVDEGNGITSLRLGVRAGTTNWTDALYIRVADAGGGGGGLGNIGIGTNSPRGVFDVAKDGDVYLANAPDGGSEQSTFLSGHVYLAPYAGSNISYLQARRLNNQGTSELRIRTCDNGNLIEAMHIAGNGSIGIGTVTPQAKLAVNGDIFSKKVKVTQTGWPDYVFHPSYSLIPLSELEKFINTYHRLPEVPSAAAVEKDGLDLGETQAVLLKKIEELTLYMIQQQKEIDALKKKMNDRVDTCTSDCCRK